MEPKAVILLAEDSEESVMTITEYLATFEYQVFSVSNGLEAVEQAQKIHPDVILMDIQMPFMDGLEAIRRIRQISTLQDVPIIAMTAMALPGDRQQCLDAGADTYISKPVRFKTMLREIRKILGE